MPIYRIVQSDKIERDVQILEISLVNNPEGRSISLVLGYRNGKNIEIQIVATLSKNGEMWLHQINKTLADEIGIQTDDRGYINIIRL